MSADSLRVCVLSKADRPGGGASKVAATLARLLQGVADLEVHHWMAHPQEALPSWGRKLHGGRLPALLRRSANALSRGIGLPDYLTPELLLHLARRGAPYDVYHLHDVSDTLSPLAIAWLARRHPVAWTFHDCSPFTGGCLYPMDCGSYARGCGECPQLAEWPQCAGLDLTRRIRRHRARLLALPGLHAVTPSAWMAREAAAATGIPELPRVIPNCVDSDLFRPHPRGTLREILGLPRERFILLLSSWSLDDVRKGVGPMLGALRNLRQRPYLLLMGAPPAAAGRVFDGFAYRCTGYVRDERLLAQYYAAADAFLFPSRADNLPNAVAESMACATPVLAYRLGGIPEMVTHGENGWLAEPGDAQALLQGVRTLRDDPGLRLRWSLAARQTALLRFGCRDFVDAHVALYRRLAGRGGEV